MTLGVVDVDRGADTGLPILCPWSLLSELPTSGVNGAEGLWLAGLAWKVVGVVDEAHVRLPGSLYSHSRCEVKQVTHEGRLSSHLT